MFLYGQPKRQPRIPSIEDVDARPTEQGGLFEYVARENGPLEQFHPQMLLQCLLWGADTRSSPQTLGFTLIFRLGGSLDKLELVKEIIVALGKHLESGAKIEEWVGLDLDQFLSHEKVTSNSQRRDVKQRRLHYDSLFAERDFDLRYVLLV